jgi:hypothetical protein
MNAFNGQSTGVPNSDCMYPGEHQAACGLGGQEYDGCVL